MKDRLREFSREFLSDNAGNSKLVERLVQVTALALLVYKPHMETFNKATRDAGFAGYIQQFVQRTT